MSNDLISRSETLDRMSEALADILISSIRNGCSFDSMKDRVMNCIKNQPTAYDVDKVVEQLEESKESLVGKYDSTTEKRNFPSYKVERNFTLDKAIDIVKSGGIKC